MASTQQSMLFFWLQVANSNSTKTDRVLDQLFLVSPICHETSWLYFIVTERVLAFHTKSGLKVSHYIASTLISNSIINEVEYSLQEDYFSTNIEKIIRRWKYNITWKKKKEMKKGAREHRYSRQVSFSQVFQLDSNFKQYSFISVY